MSGYRATPEQLTAAAASCDTTAAEVEAALTQLKTYVMGTEDWWQGIAASTFVEMMAKYQTNSQLLHEALTEIAKRLRISAANYSTAENTALSNVNTIGQVLPAANLG